MRKTQKLGRVIFQLTGNKSLQNMGENQHSHVIAYPARLVTHGKRGGNCAKNVVRRKFMKKGLFLCGNDLTNAKVRRTASKQDCPRMANVNQTMAVVDNIPDVSLTKLRQL